jgi:hypothetical protein
MENASSEGISREVKENHVSLDIEPFRENGYAVVHSAAPPALCEALVVAIGEGSGLDAAPRRRGITTRPPAWDIVPHCYRVFVPIALNGQDGC